MARELKPDVFNPTSESITEDMGLNSSDVSLGSCLGSLTSRQIAPVDAADLQIISAQLEGLKNQVKTLTQKSQKQDTIIDELVSVTALKFDRFKQAFHRVEDFVKNNINDVQGQFGKLNSKLVANNYSDEKIQQIIERHNQTIHGFESKLNQLQQVINKQEMQLMNYKSALEEARAELAKLKKL